jgi:hypothetical protein
MLYSKGSQDSRDQIQMNIIQICERSTLIKFQYHYVSRHDPPNKINRRNCNKQSMILKKENKLWVV